MKRIFIDYEKCDGCKNCSVACMQAHRKSPAQSMTWISLTRKMSPGILFSEMPQAVTSLCSAVIVTNRNVSCPV